MSRGFTRLGSLAGVAVIAAVGGCGTTPTFSGGVSARAAHQLEQDGRWAPDQGEARGGAALDLRWHLLANRDGPVGGLAVGLEEAWMPAWSDSLRGRRENALISWSLTPRQDGHTGDVGFEATLVPAGWGHIHTGGEVESAYTFGGRLGLLVRMPCWDHECDKSLFAGRTLLVVQGGWNEHMPIDAPGAPSWIGEGLVALGLRYDVSLLP